MLPFVGLANGESQYEIAGHGLCSEPDWPSGKALRCLSRIDRYLKFYTESTVKGHIRAKQN